MALFHHTDTPGKFPLQSIKSSIGPAILATNPRPPVRAGNRSTGKVVIDGQQHGFTCVVSAMTPASAIITANGWLGMPDRFWLVVKPEGTRHPCRVVSRRGNSLTVVFESSGSTAEIARPAAK